ncbi:hypothetical protein Rt10032_c18g5938 [Rhodotorula toruloides]|uniref:DUF4604 domain-containing protein n=1 Tax=Rhodotorula toruloides TaxID=5286 RepID=A0A511KNL1_RHOTO|nr:hypothetical protein Rt10032_c18g5938 [Rhodotorula toruloides]
MKRGRDPHDDPRSGPSKNQLRGLTFTAQQPAFLRNAMAALSGQPSSAPGTNGRPAVPTRPEGMEDEPESDPDEWDLGRGEEAPTVVVLKEGKHIDQSEVDRLRAQAKYNDAVDPFASSSVPNSSSKNKGSLSFSSGSAPKAKGARAGGGTGDWADVVKQSKGDSEVKSSVAKEPASNITAPARTAEELAKDREKEAKRKAKEKKAAKKKIAMLSFDEE